MCSTSWEWLIANPAQLFPAVGKRVWRSPGALLRALARWLLPSLHGFLGCLGLHHVLPCLLHTAAPSWALPVNVSLAQHCHCFLHTGAKAFCIATAVPGCSRAGSKVSSSTKASDDPACCHISRGLRVASACGADVTGRCQLDSLT